MPTTSINITTSSEAVNTYYIKTSDKTVFVKTTKLKMHSLLVFIEALDVCVEEWGEMSDFEDIYEF